MSRECHTFYKRHAEKIAEKKIIPFGKSMHWIRTRLKFSLILSCLLCLRGSRSPFFKPIVTDTNENDIHLIATESKMNVDVD